MKLKFLLTSFLFPVLSFCQTTNVSGVINTYTKVVKFNSGICIDTIFVSSINGFSIGDIALIIQMKGAKIDTTDTQNFGKVTDIGSCGNYEFAEVKKIGDNYLVLRSRLQRAYSITGSVQLVRVPKYINAKVAGDITALPWDGSVGGIVALYTTGSINLGANIDVTGKGYRAGKASLSFYLDWFPNFRFPFSSGRGGQKGEGIADYETKFEAGRGPNANGGGGGNDINSGGGGGSNFGSGGHGGNNELSPSILWGEGAVSLSNSILNRKLFLGGGGGGAHQNDGKGTSGENGGGLIFIKSNSIIGNGYSILANGNSVIPGSTIDGAGGGGAGGSILIDTKNISGVLKLEAKGGAGGNQFYLPQCHGNGGGGGGGVIAKPQSLNLSPIVEFNLSGGKRGEGQCNGTTNDATDGNNGSIVTDSITLPKLPVAEGGQDKSICRGDSVKIGLTPDDNFLSTWVNHGQNPQPFVHPINTSSYVLEVRQKNTCPIVSRDTIRVFVNQPFNASYVKKICVGEVLFIGDSLITTSGIYSQNLKTRFGCDSTITTTVQINRPDTTNLDSTKCLGQSVRIGKKVFSDSGNFTVLLKNKYGCDSTVNLHLAIIEPRTSSGSFTVCEGEIVRDAGREFPNEGSFETKLTALSTGCDSIRTTIISHVKIRVQTIPDSITKLNYGDALELQAISEGPNLVYNWEPADRVFCSTCPQTKTDSLTWNTVFTVKVRDTVFNCTASKTIRAQVNCPIMVPSLLTPNGDNQNDYLRLKNLNCIANVGSLKVFDRWGRQVYSESNLAPVPEIPLWQPSEPGIYFYQLTVNIVAGEPEQFLGWVEVK